MLTRRAPALEDSLLDFAKLNEHQRDVLGAIAIGQDGSHHPATLQALVKRGLIERYTDVAQCRFGTMHIYRYRMPIHVHIAWCEFCSREIGDSE